jgi:hypothetical protein
VLALDPILLIWTTAWAITGWKIGGGLAGFMGWGLLPLVSLTLGRPPTESLVLVLLAAILVGRRIQGNPDSSWEPHAVWRRAVFDNDPATQPLSDGIKDPLTP